MTHTAAIEVAGDGAALEPCLGELRACAVHLSESRAAIDVARNRAAIDGDEDAAVSGRGVTLSATEDILTDGAARQVHGDVARDGAAAVAAAVDVSMYRAVAHIDDRVARHTGLVAAAEDVACDVGTTVGYCNRVTYRYLAIHAGIISDVDLRAGIHGSFVAAAEDVTLDAFQLGNMDHIHHRRNCCGATRGGIISHVAATIDVGEVECLGSTIGILYVKHIDGNRTRNVAVVVTSAVCIGDYTTKQVEGDVAVDIGSFVGMSSPR